MTLVKRIPIEIKVRGKVYRLVEKMYFIEKKDADKYAKLPSINLDPKYGKFYSAVRQYTIDRGHPFYVVYKRLVFTNYAKNRARAFRREAMK